jgi:hypothetical protein
MCAERSSAHVLDAVRAMIILHAMINLDETFWRAPFSEVADEVVSRCAAAQVSLPEILGEAGVTHSTWRRWRSGSVSPSFSKFGPIVLALHKRT